MHSRDIKPLSAIVSVDQINLIQTANKSLNYVDQLYYKNLSVKSMVHLGPVSGSFS